MDKLVESIEELHKISVVLEPTAADRKDLISQVHQFASTFLDKLPTTKSYFKGTVNKDLSLKQEKQPIKKLLDLYQSQVTEKGIQAASGAHLGYIPGGGLYASSLGDYVAAVTNEYAGVHFASPGAVAIENTLLDWMKSIFGFPKSAIGNLTSGGSIANLIALTAARDKHQIKGEKIEKSVIYLSAQVHHCIHKALRIIGLGDIIVREIELDERSRLDLNPLEQAVLEDRQNGLNPFMIIASAGTTDTGAVDPIQSIGELCQREGLWYHVDAAYGGFFILLDKTKHLFKGIELADSVVIDPHKGLFIPYGLGAVLVKDQQAVMESHYYLANYMQDIVGENNPVNPADVSPELTKHFRGMRLWLPLQLYGLEPFKACLEEKILLTHYFRQKLIEMGFEVGPEPELSVSYFWFPSKTVDSDEYNERLMKLIQEDGEIFLSSTKIAGRFVIRIAILSFRTKLETVDRAIEMIKRVKAKLDSEYL